MNTLRVVLIAVPLSAAIADTTAARSSPSPNEGERAATQFAERDPRYRLQLSDELEIKFRMIPDFDQTLAIQPDGFVTLLEVGDLKVVGLTLDEVREEILARYSRILKDPHVTIKLVKFTKPYFIVGGEVSEPGRFDLEGELTASDAVAMAGGFTLGSRTTELLLFRRVSEDTVEVKKINAKMALQGNVEGDLRLRSGDTIFVPRSKVGKLDRFMSVSRVYYMFRLPFF